MQKMENGYWQLLTTAAAGTRYLYRLDGGQPCPDPASHFQPEGVHGPSEVVNQAGFAWQDQGWQGIALEKLIIYELHVGTFTPNGTLREITARLDELRTLGVTALELMPVAGVSGERNWGYDGVYPFAVQAAYGGPEGLRQLVNACHQKGLAVILDVVYNHFGPVGNYFARFGPYFNETAPTPWGPSLNLDNAGSREVRHFLFANMRHWFEDYHLDALRLDAIQAIYDKNPKHFLAELSEKKEELNLRLPWPRLLIAESNLNATRVTRARPQGGYGLEANWCDDLHHSLHAHLTGERKGYYADFGAWEHIVKTLRDGFMFGGQHSKYRGGAWGDFTPDIEPAKLVVFSQTHDMIGNRVLGERTSRLLSFGALKLFAGLVMLSPYVPLLFMGEEYGEEAPFLFFVDHQDPQLLEAIRQGRREEYREFYEKGQGPDPAALDTFARSKLQWQKRTQGQHAQLLGYYTKLLELRKTIPALEALTRKGLEVRDWEQEKVITLQRQQADSHVLCLFSLASQTMVWPADIPEGKWKKLLDASDARWGGPGARLPETIRADDKLTLLPYTVTVHLKESRHG